MNNSKVIRGVPTPRSSTINLSDRNPAGHVGEFTHRDRPRPDAEVSRGQSAPGTALARLGLRALLSAMLLVAAPPVAAAGLPPFMREVPAGRSVRVLIETVSHDSVVAGVEPGLQMQSLRDAAHLREQALAGALATAGARDLRHFWLVPVIAATLTPEAAARVLQLPGVTGLAEDSKLELPDPTLEKPGPSLSATRHSWGLEQIGAPQVWSELKIEGSGVTVAVVDSGVAPAHPEMQGAITAFRDFTADPPAAQPSDDNGHGTHVAATVAARNVGLTSVGVAPAAKLLVAKIFKKRQATVEGILRAFEWLVDPDGNPATADGARVVNGSWGGPNATDKVFWDATLRLRQLRVHPVFAAGNSGPSAGTIRFPAAYPHVLAVGATTKDDAVTRFSSRGPARWDGTACLKPGVGAPGLSILSAWFEGGYRVMDGTSMASPHVAGTLALMYSADPTLGLDEAEAILASTAKDVGVAGPDQDLGHGRIDALAAVRKVLARRGSVTVSGEADLLAAADWMTGAFSSARQAEDNPSYLDIRLHMVRIWPQRTDGIWLYVEQARADYLDRPYRQRVYHLTSRADGSLESKVHTFPDPLSRAGEWRKPQPMADLSPENLTEREGCSIFMTRTSSGQFLGSTQARNCPSDLSGAAYATSEVSITPDLLVSWDRGFDSQGRQVWGPVSGGYRFVKEEDLP